jgi:Tfp pilus assembly protein PilF
LGESALQQTHCEQAIQHLQQAVRLKPELADAHALLGKAYSQQGKTDQAEKELQIALSLNPSLGQAYYSLATLFRDTGKLDEANRYFEKFNQLQSHLRDEHNVPVFNNEGLKLKLAGRWEEAVATFRKALSINPSSATVHYNLGTVLAKQGKLREATDCYRTALRLRPGFLQAQEALALTLKSLGDPTAEEEQRRTDLLRKLTPQTQTPVSPD